MLRPGYCLEKNGACSDGDYNDGYAKVTKNGVSQMLEAVEKLKKNYQVEKVILAGQSSGAIMSALLASRGQIADHVILLGCACAFQSWKNHHNYTGKGNRGLDPMKYVEGIGKKTKFHLIVGSEDTNTLPRFSEKYQKALQENGIEANLHIVDGADHYIHHHYKASFIVQDIVL